MAITNPFSITYDTRLIGGSSGTYQLSGPYVIDKSYDEIRVTADVVVVADSITGLKSACESLERDFRKRLSDGDTFVISMSGNKWTYTVGSTVLTVTSTITKSGNPEFDRGLSRGYTVAISGQLPADDSSDAGLRDIEVLIDFTASRQKTVTFRGIYTATTAGDAKARYEADADSTTTAYLNVVDDSATWELVDETYSLDREGSGSTPAPHVLNFTRQYTELLIPATNTAGGGDQIKDHRITFTDMGQYPGDGKEEATRLRRVVGSYDCSVDVDETTNLQSVYKAKIKDYIRDLFTQNFSPTQYGVEQERVSYDETAKRISVSFQFVYQTEDGEDIIELSQSVTYRENRSIDYTPTHQDDEFAQETDVGFATLDRVWNRVAVGIGEIAPRLRIRERAAAGGPIGGIRGPENRDTTVILPEGWNVIANTSQVTPQWLGGPIGDQRIEVSVLTETVVERYNSKPGRRTSATNPTTGGGYSAPITPGGTP